MNILLDEQLDTPDTVVSAALNAMRPRHGMFFRTLRTEAPSKKDEDIPSYCHDQGIVALVSGNFRDFAAKIALYRELLAEGISVIALRPRSKREALTAERQLAILSIHSRTMTKWITAAAGAPILLKANINEIKRVSLDELVAEIEGKKPPLP